MELTREQEVVDGVARAINDGELLIPRDLTHVLVVARRAFKAGQEHRDVENVDVMAVTEVAMSGKNRVFDRDFKQVEESPERTELVKWAFEQGQLAPKAIKESSLTFTGFSANSGVGE